MSHPTGETDAVPEQPIHTASYELTDQLVDQSATLLAGDASRNPAAITSMVLLVIIVAWGFATSSDPKVDPSSPPVIATAGVLVAAAVALGTLAGRWKQVKLSRLRRSGLDLASVDKRQRRRTVSVFADRVVVAPEGVEPQVFPLASMRRPLFGPELMLLRFGANGFVPVPRRSLSATRYADLERFVREQTGTTPND